MKIRIEKICYFVSSLFCLFVNDKSIKKKNLIIAVSQRKHGSMNLYQAERGNKDCQYNRWQFLKSQKIDPDTVVSAKLVHGNKVQIVGAPEQGQVIAGYDGLITNEPKVYLSITVADCLPVFLYDPIQQVIGLAHAGWRGLDKQIIRVAVAKMQTEFSCLAQDIQTYIGPGICGQCYEVGQDMIKKFQKVGENCNSRPDNFRGDKDNYRLPDGKYKLDLKVIAKSHLQGLGVEQIKISPECTYELEDKYFSYRREKQKPIEVMMAVFGRR